ncbi:hypothetical protein CR513_51025, partial [Mucuna pruriens]
MDNGEVKSESSSDNEMPPLEDCSDMEVAETVDRVVLDTRRAIQSKEDGDVEPHEHISHTRWRTRSSSLTEVESILPSTTFSGYEKNYTKNIMIFNMENPLNVVAISQQASNSWNFLGHHVNTIIINMNFSQLQQ